MYCIVLLNCCCSVVVLSFCMLWAMCRPLTSAIYLILGRRPVIMLSHTNFTTEFFSMSENEVLGLQHKEEEAEYPALGSSTI